MTSPQSSAVLVGRELDAALAEAMGWTWREFTIGTERVEALLPPDVSARIGTDPSSGQAIREAVGHMQRVPRYSSSFVALQPVLDEIEKRGLAEEFVRQLWRATTGDVIDCFPMPNPAEFWAMFRATPEQQARAALSVLRPQEDTPK